jgi:uncharacterized protein (TIGR02391 family)
VAAEPPVVLLFDRDVDELMDLGTDELALLILPGLVAEGTVKWNDFRNRCLLRFRDQGEGHDERYRPLARRLAAAWQWLRNEGFLAPHHDHDHPAEETTEAAVGMDAAALVEHRSLSLLRRASLDRALVTQVLPIFARGLYSAATFQAMLVVETRVREASGLTHLDGVDLMKQAFKQGGPLSDPSIPAGDQDAVMALYWGAHGVFRNEAGHWIRDDRPSQEAAEVILLANTLLRLIPAFRRIEPSPSAIGRSATPRARTSPDP